MSHRHLNFLLISVVALTLMATVVAVPLLFVFRPSDADLIKPSTSPDGKYLAGIVEFDAGAVGSSSSVVLTPANDRQIRKAENSVATAGPAFFVSVKWKGKRTLKVNYGSGDVPDAAWLKRWKDVNIVYVSDLQN